jgi:hypothetical protein
MHVGRALIGTLFATICCLVGCQGATPEPQGPLAKGQGVIEAIVSDGSNVYWLVQTGDVRRVSLEGGPVETLATVQSRPRALALDEASVYFSDDSGTISRVPKQGGEVTVVTHDVAVGDLAVDDQSVYFIAGNTIETAPKNGVDTPPTQLVKDEMSPHSLHLTGTLIWATEGTSTANGVGAIREVSLTGGVATSIVAHIAPRSLALAPSHFVWAEATGPVRAANADGTDPHDVTQVDAPTVVQAIVADDQNVFFATTDGTVRQVAIAAGSTSQIVVTGPQGPVLLAMDAFNVYLANGAEGSIIAIPRG